MPQKDFSLPNTAHYYYSSTVLTMKIQVEVVPAERFLSRIQGTRKTILELALTLTLSQFSP